MVYRKGAESDESFFSKTLDYLFCTTSGTTSFIPKSSKFLKRLSSAARRGEG